MMQSSPLNFRRAVIWIGRLVLGAIFIYAGYAKIFYPNHDHLWPFFFLKFSVTMNLMSFTTQVDAFKVLPSWGVQFVGHTLPFAEVILGSLVLIGWRLRIWATMLTAIMVGFSVVVTRAYLLHMDINCGCFATYQPINLTKVLEDAALAALSIVMTWFAFVEARRPHPWAAPQSTQLSSETQPEAADTPRA